MVVWREHGVCMSLETMSKKECCNTYYLFMERIIIMQFVLKFTIQSFLYSYFMLWFYQEMF